MNEKGGNEGNYDIYSDRFPQAESLSPELDSNRSESEIAEFFRGSRWVMLDEIVVQALKNEDVDIYESLSSYTKSSEDFEQQGITSIDQAIRGVPGMINIAGRLFWRMDPVVYYIDGTIYDPRGTSNEFGVSRFAHSMRRYNAGRAHSVKPSRSPIGKNVDTPLLSEIESVVPFHIIDKIDYLRPEHSVILGRDRGGGAIVITTKSGDKISWNRQFDLKDHIPLGYQKYKEYASPILSSEADEYDIKQSPTLMWIPSVRFGNTDSEINLKFPLSYDCDIIVEGISSDGIISNVL